MNGGDPVVGGNQVTPGNTRPVIPGSQPATPAAAPQSFSTNSNIPQGSPVPTPAAPTATAPTISNTPITSDADFSSLHSSPTPSFAPPANPLASTPATSQPSSPLGAGMPAPMPGTSMQNTFTQTPLAQNSFAQNPFSGGVYSPNVYGQGEDIVIGGSTGAKPPKSKAKVILAVLAMLIVLAGVAWAVVSSFGGLIGGGSSTAEIANESLNKYFNYLLFEADSNQPISGDTTWSEDKIIENLPSSGNGNVDYFNKLSSLYDTYYNEFNESEYSSKDPNVFSSLQAAVDNNKFAIDTILSFSTKPNLSGTDITKMYFADGKDKTIAYATNYYQDFLNSNSSLLNSYGETEIKLADLTIRQIEEYNKINCVQNNTILESCTNSPSLPEAISSINEEISMNMLELNTTEYNIISNVIDNSREIYLEYATGAQNE